jgi:hypothetical protein
MVEFAVVLPMLLLIFAGVVNFGFAFKKKLVTDNAVQTAARTGASIGQDEGADMAILDSIEQGLSALPDNLASGATVVRKVTIFRATAAGGVDGGMINTYTYSGVGACGWTPCPVDESSFGSNPWLPSLRDVAIEGLDHIGVTVYYGHDWLVEGFGIFSDVPCNADGSACWTETSVMRLEPVNL